MGVDVYLNGGFPGAKVSGDTVIDAIEALHNEGFDTSHDDRDNHVKYTLRDRSKDPSSDTYLIKGHSEHPGEILDEVGQDHLLQIPIYYSSSSFTLKFAFGSPIESTDVTVQINGPDKWWFDSENGGESVVTDRCDSTVDLIATLATTVDPEVGYTTLYNDHSTGDELVATETPSDEQSHLGWNMNLEALPWVLVLGEAWIGACGGREHVRATPAADVTELETGHIVVRSTSNPASMIGGTTGEAYEHLFGE